MAEIACELKSVSRFENNANKQYQLNNNQYFIITFNQTATWK